MNQNYVNQKMLVHGKKNRKKSFKRLWSLKRKNNPETFFWRFLRVDNALINDRAFFKQSVINAVLKKRFKRFNYY